MPLSVLQRWHARVCSTTVHTAGLLVQVTVILAGVDHWEKQRFGFGCLWLDANWSIVLASREPRMDLWRLLVEFLVDSSSLSDLVHTYIFIERCELLLRLRIVASEKWPWLASIFGQVFQSTVMWVVFNRLLFNWVDWDITDWTDGIRGVWSLANCTIWITVSVFFLGGVMTVIVHTEWTLNFFSTLNCIVLII